MLYSFSGLQSRHVCSLKTTFHRDTGTQYTTLTYIYGFTYCFTRVMYASNSSAIISSCTFFLCVAHINDCRGCKKDVANRRATRGKCGCWWCEKCLTTRINFGHTICPKHKVALPELGSLESCPVAPT